MVEIFVIIPSLPARLFIVGEQLPGYGGDLGPDDCSPGMRTFTGLS